MSGEGGVWLRFRVANFNRAGTTVVQIVVSVALVLASTPVQAEEPSAGSHETDPEKFTVEQQALSVPEALMVDPDGDVAWSEVVSQGGVTAGTNESDDRFGSSLAVVDMNFDGAAELFVGSPGEDVGSEVDAGTVTYIPGNVRGFDFGNSEVWKQEGPIVGKSKAGDEFGAALAFGNTLGWSEHFDLLVGAPGKSVGGKNDAGQVVWIILNSNSHGPTRSLEQGFPYPGKAESGDRFGEAVVVADFNADGIDDVAVGAPGEDIGSTNGTGNVTIAVGLASSGPTWDGSFAFSQNTKGIAGSSKPGDGFGSALAAGDFDNDGFDDLVVGIPNKDAGNGKDSGAIHILYGSNAWVTGSGDKIFSQATSGVRGAAEDGDAFGTALAVGDFDNDGFDDVAVGIPYEDTSSAQNGGAVQILYGSSAGVTASGDKVFTQATSGIKGKNESGDHFGSSLANGDFDNDGYDDLAIGVPGEDTSAGNGVGSVQILFGSANGLSASGDKVITQGTSGVAGKSEASDRFGSAVAVGDLSADGNDDLAVGVPHEDLGGDSDVGNVVTLDPNPYLPWVTTDQPDDLGGSQLHVLFVLAADAEEPRNIDAAVRHDIGVVDNWYEGQLGGSSLRWDTTGGDLDLSIIRIGLTKAEINNGSSVPNIINAMKAAGFDDPDKDYVAYVESAGNACGFHSDGYAVIWKDSCNIFPQFTEYPSGSTYLVSHELTHLLGAVAACAPNHEGTGHVDDDNRDVLYGGAGGRDWDNLMLDVGNDDYYDHDNDGCLDIADSPVIGP